MSKKVLPDQNAIYIGSVQRAVGGLVIGLIISIMGCNKINIEYFDSFISKNQLFYNA